TRLAIVSRASEGGRDREWLEVFGVEWSVTIGSLQQPIRFGPRSLLERLPPTLPCRDVRHVARLDRKTPSVATRCRCRLLPPVRRGACPVKWLAGTAEVH